MTRLDVKEQIPDQEVTSSKDSIYINVQSLKEYSRHIIAMANEFDRQKAVITKTELQMTSLLRTCRQQELELRSLKLENLRLLRTIKDLSGKEISPNIYLPHELPLIITDDIMNVLSLSLVSDFDLDTRTINTLRKMEIYTLEDLLRYTKDKGLQVLLKYRGFGAHSLALLKESLIKKGVFERSGTSGLYKYVT